MPLADYKDLVGAVAAITTIGQFFSPVVMCYDIIKKKSTKNVDATPFIGGMGMAVLMYQHGLILNDSAMIPVNIAGFLLNLIYFIVYYTYSKDKTQLLMSCAKIAAGCAVLVGYARVDNIERVEFNYGVIVTILLLTLIAAPLFSLKEIIKTKCSAILPFPLILTGTCVSFLWLLYGIIIENVFIQFQNVVGFGLCVIQLSLCFIYPRTPAKTADKTKKKK